MAKAADASTNLEKVTDHHEEADISSSSSKAVALSGLVVASSSLAAAADDGVDMSLTVSSADIQIIVESLDVSQADAERALRMNGGSAENALRALMRP